MMELNWKTRDKTLQYKFHRLYNHKRTTEVMLFSSNNGRHLAYHRRRTCNNLIHRLWVDITEAFIQHIDHATTFTLKWDERYEWCVYDEAERNELNRDCKKDKYGEFPLIYYGMSEARITEIMELVKGEFEFDWGWAFNYRYRGYSRRALVLDMCTCIKTIGKPTDYETLDETDILGVAKIFAELVVRPIVFTFKLIEYNEDFENKFEKLEDQLTKYEDTQNSLRDRLIKLDEKMGAMWI